MSNHRLSRLFLTISWLVVIASARPRGIIVLQADDLNFMENWTPPAHLPGESAHNVYLPNLDRLRTNGLQMMRAYSASPMCGTSRYSTMTGRYPSRAASSRYWNYGDDVSSVKIANTKLMDFVQADVEDGLDCARHNIAQVLRQNGYRTGIIGKWHLDGSSRPYNYREIQDRIRSCGFDTAEAIYHENLNLDWTNDGEFTHNMEHLAMRAIEYMDSALDSNEDFFMYFNPTAPHASGNVFEALTRYSCRDTVEGRLAEEPWIPGMTAGVGCEAYRRTVLRRGEGDASNEVLGAIWVDDAVGALLTYLESRGILDETLIVFQLDHGKEGKGSIYEAGTRIAQFAHYPSLIPPGIQYSGLVSTIDVTPTILDYAGITQGSRGWYEMDGTSWRGLPTNNRCVVLEDRYDRAVVCGCDKYLEIGETSGPGTYRKGTRYGMVINDQAAFDLCDRHGEYVTSPYESPEAVSAVIPMYELVSLLNCHYEMTNPNVRPTYGRCDPRMFRSTPYRLVQSASAESPEPLKPSAESPEPVKPSAIIVSTENGPQSRTFISSAYVNYGQPLHYSMLYAFVGIAMIL